MQNTSGNGSTGNQGGQSPKQGGLSWGSSANKQTTPGSTSQQKPFTPPVLKPTTSTHRHNDERSGGMGRMVGIFAGGLIVGFLLGWGWNATRSSPVATNTDTKGSTTSTQTTSGSNTAGSGIGITNSGNVTSSSGFSVPSPQSSGFQVAVSNASVTGPTWLAVYDSVNNQPGGKSLGAMVFFPTTKSGTIELLRGTLPGKKYFVVQMMDDGDFVFSSSNDKPVRDAQGNPVWASFETR